MKKIIAVAALTAASFAVPTLPVQAEDINLNCLVFPLLKDECKPAWIDDAPEAAAATASATVETVVEWSWPAPPNCVPAPAGSGHLYDCEM
jgi:hypothetical protein